MIDLSSLTNVQELFKLFNTGAHLNREQDLKLWKDLEDQLDDYTTLFSALGYSLVLDSRGFAYFKTEQGSSYTGKQSRRLALILMLLFEFQADRGLHLFQFNQWRVDEELISSLWKQYHAILEAEELIDANSIKEVFDNATRIGFASIEDQAYQLLPSTHRYLDLFEELAQAQQLSGQIEEIEDQEDDA